MAIKTRLAIDSTVTLDVNGSTQRIRLCAERTGLPPLLIVQGGPALPLLNEVAKFQQRLRLEKDFLVAYWEQRGCGAASKEDAKKRVAAAAGRRSALRPALVAQRDDAGRSLSSAFPSAEPSPCGRPSRNRIV